MKTIAIMQPTFLPWIGYFSMIDRVDAFVFLDSVQFAKRSWQQRNQIKGPTGPQWITVPVASSGLREQLIKDVKISADGDVAKKLIHMIQCNYSRAPFFKEHSDAFFEVLLREKESLCGLNMELIRVGLKLLTIEGKPIFRSSEMPVEGSKSDLLVSICKHMRADCYLSAPGSREYIDASTSFSDAGIQVSYHNYEHPKYRQQFGEFVPYMSIIDLLFNEGDASLGILRGTS